MGSHIGPPLIFILCFLAVFATHRAPKLHLPSGEVYHGYIDEDGQLVTVTPHITVEDNSGPVCSYVIKEPSDIDDAPFEFHVTDKDTGAVELKAKLGVVLDCSHSEYRLSFVAVRCNDDEESDIQNVVITVRDKNNHAPVFDQAWYAAEVQEGRVYEEIAKVKATDADCSHPHGEICRYEIVNNKDLFTISDNGVVRNLEPLNASVSGSHVLTIVASDCSMTKSKEVLLTIKVHKACRMGLTGVPSRVEYYPGSGNKILTPDATLNICNTDCQIKTIQARITLRTQHIGQGCDRESFASTAQRRVCEVDGDTVELLPRPSQVSDEQRGNDVTDWKDGDDDEVYNFDGASNAIVVPPETTKAVIPDTFTVSFSMKHHVNQHESPNYKENILCSSDDNKMNRHHFAVYVRHCKLEVLYRTEAGDEIEKYRPAEWRYTLADVCDGEWHHYTLNMHFPDLDLYVDGRAFPNTQKNPDILDDYPIPNRKGIKMRLVVGACWHGRSQKMDQFFKGWLASMLYLPKSNERPGVLQCLHQCKEQLKFEGLDRLHDGDKAVFNSEMSELTLEASKLDDFNELIRKVAYVNLRDTPTMGHRQFNINTNIMCSNKHVPVDTPESSGYVLVSEAPDPIVTLTGTDRLIKTADQTKAGTSVLSHLNISVQQQQLDGTKVGANDKYKLDWCRVTLTPKLESGEEYFSSPAKLIGALNLDFNHDADGVSLSGTESVKGYEDVLQQMHYFNINPDESAVRHFAVKCALRHGKVESNQLHVLVTLTNKALEAPHIDRIVATVDDKPAELDKIDAAPRENVVELRKDDRMTAHQDIEKMRQEASMVKTLQLDTPGASMKFKSAGAYTFSDDDKTSVAGGTVVTVVVVCVGLLLVLIVVGVLKLKANSHGYRKASNAEQGELVWDDAGLNITVNPLEDVEKISAEDDSTDDDSSDGEEGSYHSDSDDDEGGSVLPHLDARTTGLEWDDSSNLDSPPAPSRSSVYRV